MHPAVLVSYVYYLLAVVQISWGLMKVVCRPVKLAFCLFHSLDFQLLALLQERVKAWRLVWDGLRLILWVVLNLKVCRGYAGLVGQLRPH